MCGGTNVGSIWGVVGGGSTGVGVGGGTGVGGGIGVGQSSGSTKNYMAMN